MSAGGPAALRDPATLLAAWEAGASAPDVARGAAVLAAVDGGSWLDRPISEMAAGAAKEHAAAFSEQVNAVVPCEGCGLLLEVQIPLADLVTDFSGEVETLDLSIGRVAVRAPSTRDLAAAADHDDARETITHRCLSDATGHRIDAGRLSAADRALVAAALDELVDPAVPVVRIACPDCAREVSAVVDAASLLWERINADAPVLLREVAELAGAFGWSESELLALPESRRRVYLRLAGR